MSKTHDPASDLLKRVRDNLQQESAHIQIQGRALTDEEKRRVEKIGRAIPLIDQALNELGGDEDTDNW